MLSAEQIMTTGVVTIRPEASIQDAIDLILKRRISGLPVVDSAGKLCGILTEFALLAMAYDQDVTHQCVYQHMTRDVITADASTPANQLADLFIIHRVRRLPILKHGRLAGLVSRVDVLRALCAEQAPVCTA